VDSIQPGQQQQQQQQQPSRRISMGNSSGKSGSQSGLPPPSPNQRPLSLQSSRNSSSDNFGQYQQQQQQQPLPAEESLSRQPSGSGITSSSSSSLGSGLGVASAFPRPSGSEMRNRVKGLLAEYLQLGDINEVQLILVELGIESCGFFIQELIRAYVDCSPKQQPKATKLFGLIPQLEEVLTPAKLIIEASLSDFDLISQLQDFICDCHEVSFYMIYVYKYIYVYFKSILIEFVFLFVSCCRLL